MASSRNIGSLTIDLIARTFGFEQGMDKAARSADKRMREIVRNMKITGAAIGAALAGAATVAAAGIKAAIDYADQLNDMNQRLGVSAEALSGWAYAAKQTGTDIDALGVGLKKLSKNMAEALDPKSKQGMLFDSLGVSVKNAEGNLRAVEDVLPEIADRFKTLDNATLESAVAMDLFGKSGTDLLEFLNLGADGIAELRQEARDYGLELSQNTLAAADQFNDNLTKLRSATTGVWTEIANGMLPKLGEMTDEMAAAAKQTEGLRSLGDGLITVIDGMANAFGFVAGMARQFGIDVAASVEGLKGWAEVAKNIATFGAADGSVASGLGAIQNAKKTRQEMIADQQRARAISQLEANIHKLQREATGVYNGPLLDMGGRGGAGSLERRLNSAYGPTSSSKKSSGKSDAEREAERLQNAYKSLKASIEERIALFGKEGETLKERYDLESGLLAGLDQKQKEQLRVRLDKIDMLAAEADVQSKLNEIDKQRQDSIDRAIESANRQIDDMEFELALLGMTNKEREREIALRYAGANATEEQRKRIAELSDQMDYARKVSEGWAQVQSGISDVLFDTAKNASSALDSIKNLFDSIWAYITRSIADQWAESFVGLFKTGGASSGGGGVFNVIGDFLGSLFGGGMATGGWTNPNTMYEVNERGLEMASVNGRDYLLTGRSPVEITPAHRLGGGGNSITQNFINPRMTDKSTATQRERDAARRAQRAMVKA